MTKSEEIALLNTLHKKIEDWECDGDTCYYVTIEFDDEAHRVLNQLGVDGQYIQVNQTEGNNGNYYLDIAPIGFQHCGAAWWDSFMGFMEERP
ncbi:MULTISPECIES: hypothetical protein [Bacillales]|uniref:hypothetical protein n=1 Tax=Bacillales TaxID=1385 RepID=UPI0003457FE5|nr:MULTISPECIES: hypothetical protein [Bacillales]KMZ42533.1 hypothetical protein AC624_16160 [Bacillus sp. FJAT-27238]